MFRQFCEKRSIFNVERNLFSKNVKLIKWIICFSPILLKVFFDQHVIISSLSNENPLTLEITIVRDDSKYGVAEISLHESGEFPQEKIPMDQMCWSKLNYIRNKKIDINFEKSDFGRNLLAGYFLWSTPQTNFWVQWDLKIKMSLLLKICLIYLIWFNNNLFLGPQGDPKGSIPYGEAFCDLEALRCFNF